MKVQKFSCDNKVLIDIKEIKPEPGPFTMSFGFNPIPLAKSIKKIGLINPPLVIKDAGGGFDVVSGYRRLMTLKHLDEKQVHCIDLSDSGMSSKELFFLNFYENLTIRSFNLVEKGMIVHRLSSYVSKKDIIRHYLPLLQISNINDLDVFFEIEKFNNQLKEFIAKGLLSLKTVRSLIDMDEESREAMIKLIVNIKLNFNYQYQLTEYLKDISSYENCSIHKILNEDQFQSILKDERANNPQKVKNFYNLIRDRKFPFLTKSEKTFRKKIAGLNLPDKTKIGHSPFFEAPDFILDISFENGQELLEKIRYLSKLESLASITPPWQSDGKR